ncbi:MAG: hypothetical protein E7199_03645 [Schwartzia succinivorans]|nr:hypothetical protein [Schwartzia succinivorans]
MAIRTCTCCGRSYDDEDVFAFDDHPGEELWNLFFAELAKDYRSCLPRAKEAVEKIGLSHGGKKRIVTRIKNMVHDFGDQPLSDDESGVEMLSETTALMKTGERLEEIGEALEGIMREEFVQKRLSFDKYKDVNGLSYLRFIAPDYSGGLYQDISESVQKSADKEMEKPFAAWLRDE